MEKERKEQTASSVKRDQYAIYASILVLSAFIAVYAYRNSHKSYLIMHKASVFFSNGDYENAIPLYEKSIQLGLIRKKSVLNLFIAYEKTEKDNNILNLFELLASATNNKTIGYDSIKAGDVRRDGSLTIKGFLFHLAGYLESKGRFNDIIPLFDKHKSLWKNDLRGCIFMADGYRNTGRPDKAEEWYGIVSKKMPDALYPKFRFGEMLAQQGKFDEAVDVFRSILRNYPDNRPTRIHLARALGNTGAFREAIQEYKHILGESL